MVGGGRGRTRPDGRQVGRVQVVVALVRRRVHQGRLRVVRARTSVLGALLRAAATARRYVQVGVQAPRRVGRHRRRRTVGQLAAAQLKDVRRVGVDVLRRVEARVAVDGDGPDVVGGRDGRRNGRGGTAPPEVEDGRAAARVAGGGGQAAAVAERRARGLHLLKFLQVENGV